MKDNHPRLYGIKDSNRDFAQQSGWGKNVFNNAFPVALLCYMDSLQRKPVYLKLDKETKEISRDYVSVKEVFGIDPNSTNLSFQFERTFTPYSYSVSDPLPRIDLITLKLDPDRQSIVFLRDLEIKLTALPDHSTFNKDEDMHSCELVIRPDTIVYLALRLIDKLGFSQDIVNKTLLSLDKAIVDWSNPKDVVSHTEAISDTLSNVLTQTQAHQAPFVIQTIWRTVGQTLSLSQNCFDVFVWSDLSLAKIIINNMRTHKGERRINRSARAAYWLAKMFVDFAQNREFNHQEIKEELSFGSQTDKAFAFSGAKTYQYLKSQELSSPRITKDALPKIILGGGQNLLSPERRLDAAIVSNLSLFGKRVT